MNSRLLLAWLHLLALAIGIAGAWARARALRDSLRDPEDRGAMGRAYAGDSWWGVAAGLWLVTGLWRLFAGTEKATSYYVTNHAFQAKMGLFVVIVALEIWPMRTLLRWRRGLSAPNPRDAGRIEIISYVQCVLAALMVLAAVSMARGYGSPASAGSAARPSSAAAPAPASPVGEAPAELVVSPTGTESVSADDIALLTHEIVMPLEGIDPASLRSNFDERRGGGTRQHQALDIMAPRRTVIHSAARGRVLRLFTSAAGGLMVYAADSSERWILMYAHLDGYADALRDGAPLARGQEIGYVGSTGNASPDAPHLHFAIARSADVRRWSRGTPVDPLPVLQASARVTR